MKSRRERLATEAELDAVIVDSFHFVRDDKNSGLVLKEKRTRTMRQVRADSPGYLPWIVEYVDVTLFSLLNMPGSE